MEGVHQVLTGPQKMIHLSSRFLTWNQACDSHAFGFDMMQNIQQLYNPQLYIAGISHPMQTTRQQAYSSQFPRSSIYVFQTNVLMTCDLDAQEQCWLTYLRHKMSDDVTDYVHAEQIAHELSSMIIQVLKACISFIGNSFSKLHRNQSIGSPQFNLALWYIKAIALHYNTTKKESK